MTKNEKKVFSWLSILIFIQGVLYFIAKYFMQVETQFGPRPHQLTSSLLHMHILLVPLLVLNLGYLLSIHILPKLKAKFTKRKNSGLVLLALMLLMIVSGYFLQMGFTPNINTIIGTIHSVVSLVWFVLFLWHSRKKLGLSTTPRKLV